MQKISDRWLKDRPPTDRELDLQRRLTKELRRSAHYRELVKIILCTLAFLALVYYAGQHGWIRIE